MTNNIEISVIYHINVTNNDIFGSFEINDSESLWKS